MRGILIDPFSRTVSEVQVESGLADIRRAIGCDLVTAVQLRDGSDDVAYLDDEGLFAPDQAWFSLDGHPQAYAGKGLVLGTVGEGRDGPATHSVEDVLSLVRWSDPRMAAAMEPPVSPNKEAATDWELRSLQDAVNWLTREAESLGCRDVASLLAEAARRLQAGDP